MLIYLSSAVSRPSPSRRKAFLFSYFRFHGFWHLRFDTFNNHHKLTPIRKAIDGHRYKLHIIRLSTWDWNPWRILIMAPSASRECRQFTSLFQSVWPLDIETIRTQTRHGKEEIKRLEINLESPLFYCHFQSATKTAANVWTFNCNLRKVLKRRERWFAIYLDLSFFIRRTCRFSMILGLSSFN